MVRIPMAVIIGTGLAVNNSVAVVEAILGKKSEFVRTPKWGVREKTKQWRRSKYNITSSSFLIQILELFYALYSLAGIYIALRYGKFFILPYFVVYSASFLYVFFLGMAQKGLLGRLAKQ